MITTWEVKRHSIVEREYPEGKINSYKKIIEEEFIRTTLGQDFLDNLKADVIDWSTAIEWKAGSYAVNYITFYKGDVYKSLQNSNTQEPGPGASQWTLAKKFTTTEYDTLWKEYLVKIISNKIIYQTAVLDTYKADGKGLVVTTQDQTNMNALNDKEVGHWSRQVKNLTDLLINEMINYITVQYDKYKENPATGFNYEDVDFIKAETKKAVQNPSSSRMNYRY